MDPPFRSPEEVAPSAQEADFHDRWVWISQWIVSGGIFLGFLAKLAVGREFKTSDPLIGPILLPLAIVWVLAFFHLLYTRLRGQLSAPVRWLCYFTIALFATILLFAIFSGGSSAPQGQTNGEQVGAGQPATRFESDSEGRDKPQSESEGRSR